MTGFASSGLQTYLPLSPRHQLLLADDEVYCVRNTNGCVRVDRHHDVKGLNALQLLFVENSLYYHHTTATQAAIDDLPFHWRHDRVAAVHVQRAVADGQRSQLVGFHEEQPDVRLDLSFVRVHRDKTRVPLPDRMRSLRERAVDADRFFRGERTRPAPSSTPRSFRVVERD